MKRFLMAAVNAVLFIFTATLFSCKSYPADSKVKDFMNNDNNSVTYIDKGSYSIIKPAAMTEDKFSDNTLGFFF